MEIRKRLTGAPAQGIDLARAAITLWGGDSRSLQPVSHSANQVYSFAEWGGRRYLRLTPSSHRTADQIEAELDFIAHLHRNGVSAMLPVASTPGRLIEEFPFAGGSVFACVFEEAAGERFRYDPAKPNKDHLTIRGKTLGRIHALSKTYIPSRSFRRFSWNEDKLLLAAEKFLPKSETVVWRAYDELSEWLHGRPQTSENYGLVHGDFGETNYRYRRDRFNVFDFDDCCYHWFAYDLAVAIYPHGWRKEGLQLLEWLLEGYSVSMQADVKHAEIATFCQWRLVYLFLVYARRWGFENLSAQQSEWFAVKRENIARRYQWRA